MATAVKAKAAPAAKEMSWTERVAVALKKAGGKARLTEIVQHVPLPKDWNPKKHQGSHIKGQKESIQSRVWSTLQRGEQFEKVESGVYRLVVTVKKRQVFKAGEKKAPASGAKK